MKPLDATSRARGTVSMLALATALSGCYYYVPYDAVPTTATQQWQFTMPDAAASDAAVSTYAYSALAAPVFVEPAYYPVAYPYYGWPPWWGPSVSLSLGYWGGCCTTGVVTATVATAIGAVTDMEVAGAVREMEVAGAVTAAGAVVAAITGAAAVVTGPRIERHERIGLPLATT